MSAIWGFLHINQCHDCGLIAEIWTTSVKSDYSTLNQPTCVGCRLTDLGYMNNSPQFFELQDDITELLKNNPRTREDIYGKPTPVCFGCWNLIENDNKTVKAFDLNGDEYLTQDDPACYVTCEGECGQIFVSNSYPYRRARTSIPFKHRTMHLNLDNERMCEPCLSSHYSVSSIGYLTCCENCQAIGLDESFRRFSACSYCENCYENNVYDCEDCDETYWSDDGHDCDNGVIHDFDYKPSPVFFGHSDARYYLGFELEVENVDEVHGTLEIAEHVQNALGEHIYLKRDGSISNGFEIVSHPHTLEAHKNEIKWSVLDELRSSGFRSWNTDTCGIHVHVSRTAFGNGEHSSRRRRTLTAQAHELRFMKLVYDNQRQAERLAGRSSGRWASFSDKGQLVQKVKHGYQNNDRYSAINTENAETLEVRIFKGSLKKERVLSALEFVTACVEYTRDLKVTSTNMALSWVKFVGYVADNQATYPHLFDKINDSFSRDSVTN